MRRAVLGLAFAALAATVLAASPDALPAAANGAGPLSLRINFQPPDVDVPDGYLPDGGAPYADRGDGFVYGWDTENARYARDRDSRHSPDQRYDTYNILHRKKHAYTWEVAVPNGHYAVRVVAGDTRKASKRRYQVDVEGVLVVDGALAGSARWTEGVQIVAVADGRLTVTNGPGGRKTKICFIHIDDAPGGLLEGPLPLDDVRFWAYQLQRIEDEGGVDQLANSAYDMLVLEPTRTDWSWEGSRDFDTAATVARLKASPAHDGRHRKLVIAYVDIGEAEDWRWYWTWSRRWKRRKPMPDDWPDYIVARDPDGWDGCYPVAYWHPDWKDVMITGNSHPPTPDRDFVSALDEVIRDGFDGIYLDWVEGYEDENVQLAAAADGVDPAEEMIAFIGEIRAYARARNPDFVVIQQNAAELLDGRPHLLDAIDAIAQEAIWYDGTGGFDKWKSRRGYDRAADPELTDYYIGWLDQYKAAGIPVFNCEYAKKRAPQAYQLSAARGYIPYCTRRSLARLTTTPPPGY